MIDWDDAFDNSGYVPEAAEIGERWVSDAEAFRLRARSELDVSYGGHERQRLDLFWPEGEPVGTVVFVHGGYWHSRAKSDWSHFAGGFTDAGWAVAIVGYPLAPEVRVSEITVCIADAVGLIADRIAGPIRLVGHSAGGHLVSRMACRDVLPDPVASRIARVVSVSGVHDLRPLLGIKMNDQLKLTAEEASAESPALLEPLGVSMTFWVGANERPEFLRQTRLIAESWALKGADVFTVYEAGHNHFTVINGLAEPESDLVAEVLR